jgi:hypothetical protein
VFIDSRENKYNLVAFFHVKARERSFLYTQQMEIHTYLHSFLTSALLGGGSSFSVGKLQLAADLLL